VPLEASFTSDSQFIVSGFTNGKIHIWDVLLGNETVVLNSNNSGTVATIKYNPKYMILATACLKTVLFIIYF
jgi:WD40 repeat protein